MKKENQKKYSLSEQRLIEFAYRRLNFDCLLLESINSFSISSATFWMFLSLFFNISKITRQPLCVYVRVRERVRVRESMYLVCVCVCLCLWTTYLWLRPKTPRPLFLCLSSSIFLRNETQTRSLSFGTCDKWENCMPIIQWIEKIRINRVKSIEKMSSRKTRVPCYLWKGTEVSPTNWSVFFHPLHTFHIWNLKLSFLASVSSNLLCRHISFVCVCTCVCVCKWVDGGWWTESWWVKEVKQRHDMRLFTKENEIFLTRQFWGRSKKFLEFSKDFLLSQIAMFCIQSHSNICLFC
jgi:hypothetical protein